MGWWGEEEEKVVVVEEIRGGGSDGPCHLEHVELHAALDVDLLRLARPHLLRLEHLVLHPRLEALQPAEVREALDLERARAVEEVRQVEVDDVVPGGEEGGEEGAG